MASKLSGARVSPQARAVFEAMQFLKGLSSQQDLLGPVLEEQAAAWAQLPEVQEALKQRELHQGKSAGTIRELSTGDPAS